MAVIAYPVPIIAEPLQSSFRLFQGNHTQLFQYLQYVEESPNSIELWSQRNNQWFQIIEEITRLLFNYAVSAVTFIELADKLFDKLPKVDELLQLLGEYKQEKKDLIDNNPNYQIIRGIRHYLVHSDILRLGSTFSWNRNIGHEHSVVVTKKQLLTLNSFNKIARRKLQNSEPEIAVRFLAEGCFNDLQTLNNWLQNKQIELLNDRNFHI